MSRVTRVVSRHGWLQPGALGSHLEGFIADLEAAGYTRLSIGGYEASVAHFGGWLERRGIAIDDIDDEVVKSFAAHRCACPGGRRATRVSRRYVRRVRRFVEDLCRKGIVKETAKTPYDPHAEALEHFRSWMLQHRGVSTRTIDRHERLVRKLLPSLGGDLATYDAALIRRVVLSEGSRCGRAHAKTVITALRMYLRFLAAQGHCRPLLDQAVPRVPQWRLSSLPRYLSPSEVECLLAACNTSVPCGMRDRAVLLLLARLGLRGGDIVSMQLKDIDWQDGILRVRGKGRRETQLPLPQDVGDGILAYLEHARPPVAIDRAFLCANAPYRPFPSSVNVSDIVRLALRRANIQDPPSRGANLLRHTAATTMLRRGASLDAIGSVVRHRSVQTTTLYAKVDIAMLLTIAQPWPVEEPC